MNSGMQALGKARGYIYMILGFYVLLMFHEEIANLFHTTDTKILNGFIMLIVIQSVVCSMYMIKYVQSADEEIKRLNRSNGKKQKASKASVQRGKDFEVARMYAARTRYFMLAQVIICLILLLNSSQINSIILDKVAICGGIILVFYILKYLTILQRGRFN